MTEQSLVPAERITRVILLLRGHKVLLDADLAVLYGVDTRTLNQAVQRNVERFPSDFMFQLSEEEAALRSQVVILKKGRGQHRKYLPYAFTEQGVAMLSSVLRSPQAVQVNIEIMRAFVRMRQLQLSDDDMGKKLAALEKKYERHDAQFRVVFQAIRALMDPPTKKKRPIGFRSEPE